LASILNVKSGLSHYFAFWLRFFLALAKNPAATIVAAPTLAAATGDA